MRQRQIERLVASSEPWIAPFVTQLCDEYVIEILDAVEAHLSSMDQHTYGAFFRENSLFFQRTRDRMISYGIATTVGYTSENRTMLGSDYSIGSANGVLPSKPILH